MGKSFIEELWDYFVEFYLEANTAYPNLGMDGESIVSLPVIIAGLCIGTLVAVFAAMHESRVIGGYVRKMLEGKHIGKENAVTLEMLGTGERSSFGKALVRSVSLRRYVVCVEEEDFYEKKINGEIDTKEEYKHTVGEHFYIPEDKRIGAEFKYVKRSVKWWVIPIIVVGILVAFFALMLVIPYILELIDSFIGSFKSV